MRMAMHNSVTGCTCTMLLYKTDSLNCKLTKNIDCLGFTAVTLQVFN